MPVCILAVDSVNRGTTCRHSDEEIALLFDKRDQRLD